LASTWDDGYRPTEGAKRGRVLCVRQMVVVSAKVWSRQ